MFFGRKDKEARGKPRKKKKVMKKIEGPLWGHMVQEGVVVDILQNLRYVAADVEVDGKPATKIRIFDPAKLNIAGIDIEGFNSFDACPEQVLYEGYLDKRGHPVSIRKKT